LQQAKLRQTVAAKGKSGRKPLGSAAAVATAGEVRQSSAKANPRR
jgi:hypothetical protein